MRECARASRGIFQHGNRRRPRPASPNHRRRHGRLDQNDDDRRGSGDRAKYKLFGDGERFRYTIFNFDHNYNKTTREAVYDAFGHWLLKNPDAAALKEAAYQMEPVESLRVFPGGRMPADAKDEPGVIAMLIDRSMKQLDALKRAKLDDAKSKLLPAWQHTLQVEFPDRDLIVQRAETKKIGEITRHTLHVGRQGREIACRSSCSRRRKTSCGSSPCLRIRTARKRIEFGGAAHRHRQRTAGPEPIGDSPRYIFDG